MKNEQAMLNLEMLQQMINTKQAFENKALLIFKTYFKLKNLNEFVNSCDIREYKCDFQENVFIIKYVRYAGDMDLHDDFKFPLEYLFIDNWLNKMESTVK